MSQKNADLIVTAENKFKEIRSIYVLKKKFIEKNKTLKEHIFGLELIEHRYRCETEWLDKNKKKRKINFSKKMDFVCCVLKQYYLINEKEEENMKKKNKRMS